MEILCINNAQELSRKQIYTGTVRSIKRKTVRQTDENRNYDQQLPQQQQPTPWAKSSTTATAAPSTQPSQPSLAVRLPIVSAVNEGVVISLSAAIAAAAATSATATKMPLVWNASGWLRIYCGPDRSKLCGDDPSRMVHVTAVSTTEHIAKDMDLPCEYTIWVQIGGGTSRRLTDTEHPFLVQENFLKQLGYADDSRRARLGIDPELKYLIRFHIGPAEIPMCRGVLRSGTVEILKGLVFPQWRRRSIAIVGNKLFLFPGNSYAAPEIYDLSEADIFEHTPGYNRLILKIVPKVMSDVSTCSSSNTNSIPLSRMAGECGGMSAATVTETAAALSSNATIYSSLSSVHSTPERQCVLFIGFEESWERDMWSAWLYEHLNDSSEPKRMDIGGSGLQTIPEIVLQSTNQIEELLAGQNKLQEIALHALAAFPCLKILRLPGNGFESFPVSLLQITALTILDLADNGIEHIPDEISVLENLEELRLDRNRLKELPNSLRILRRLWSLQLAQNELCRLPTFLVKMKSFGLLDGTNKNRHESFEMSEITPPLTKINLRANNLKGHIVLGNYGNLTQLDVSENAIEFMDLSALSNLDSVLCSKNNLKELIVNGQSLKSLISGNNVLTKLTVSPVPTNLRHLDVSYNNLVELPDWLNGCHQLRTLFASNNLLENLPDHLFCSEKGTLHTLQLGFNRLSSLPAMPLRKLPLMELFIQNNRIAELPDNFFIACGALTLLNVSSNKLTMFPIVEEHLFHLERLYVTNNELTDQIIDSLHYFDNLKVFHAAFNRLTTLPESCIANWPDLEEIVLSGNRLQHLPENLIHLKHLKVLRVHSNQLQSAPALSKTDSLRVLDLAHNQLDKINLVTLVPRKLQFLDVSCNKQLQVDPKQLQACRSARPMSLVDVSGKNRASLPIGPIVYQENADFDPPWKVGFSETAGTASKLYISQLRLPGFCNSEGLFGMFDGELNGIVPNLLITAIPKILLEERTVKETASDYMKYTLLSAHRELKQDGQKHGVCATLCHISRSKLSYEGSMMNGSGGGGSNSSGGGSGRRFMLRVASVGETSALLIRQSGNVRLTPTSPRRQIGNSANFPLIIPNPEIAEIALGDQDEYLVIANKKLWEVMDTESVVTEIRRESNVILAAKRVQDIAQSYGAEENLSIIIVKFMNLGTDVDFLMRELRQTIRKKPTGASVISGFCKCGCCCESNNSCCHSGVGGQFVRQPSAGSSRSDRSSPSGQSDQTMACESSIGLAKSKFTDSMVSSKKSTANAYATNERRSLRGGVVRAVRAKIEEEREKEDCDSTLSEEQFKCWEYMLEQNTQLLFDKELDTISRVFTKRVNPSNLSRPTLKAMATSSPHLSVCDDVTVPVPATTTTIAPNVTAQYAEPVQATNIPFLSKHFGSARAYHPQATANLFKAMRFGSNRVHPVNGGPNAAYFGSLQRLMPYNLEYDFAVMQEREHHQNMPIDDTMDPEGRMHQYWGVATTEL